MSSHTTVWLFGGLPSVPYDDATRVFHVRAESFLKPVDIAALAAWQERHLRDTAPHHKDGGVKRVECVYDCNNPVISTYQSTIELDHD